MIQGSFTIPSNKISIQGFPSGFSVNLSKFSIDSIKMNEKYLISYANDPSFSETFKNFIDNDFKIDNLLLKQYLIKKLEHYIIEELKNELWYIYSSLPTMLNDLVEIDLSSISELTSSQIEKSFFYPITLNFPIKFSSEFFPMFEEDNLSVSISNLSFSPQKYDLSRFPYSHNQPLEYQVNQEEINEKIIKSTSIVQFVKKALDDEIWLAFQNLPISFKVQNEMWKVDKSFVDLKNFEINQKNTLNLKIETNEKYYNNPFFGSVQIKINFLPVDNRVSLSNPRFKNEFNALFSDDKNIVYIADVKDSENVTEDELKNEISTNSLLLKNITNCLETVVSKTVKFNKDFTIDFYQDDEHSPKPGNYSEADTAHAPNKVYIYINSTSNTRIFSDSTQTFFLQIMVLVNNTEFDLSTVDNSDIGNSEEPCILIESLNPDLVLIDELSSILDTSSNVYKQIFDRILEKNKSVGYDDVIMKIQSDQLNFNLVNSSPISILVSHSDTTKLLTNGFNVNVYIQANQKISDISNVQCTIEDTLKVPAPNPQYTSSSTILNYLENNDQEIKKQITTSIKNTTHINSVTNEDFTVNYFLNEKFYDLSNSVLLECIHVVAKNLSKITGEFTTSINLIGQETDERNIDYEVSIEPNSNDDGTPCFLNVNNRKFKVGIWSFYWSLKIENIHCSFTFNQKKLDVFCNQNPEVLKNSYDIRYWADKGIIDVNSINAWLSDSTHWISGPQGQTDSIHLYKSNTLKTYKDYYNDEKKVPYYSLSLHVALSTQVGFYSGNHGTGKTHTQNTKDSLFDNFLFTPIQNLDGSFILKYKWNSLDTRNKIFWGVRGISDMYDKDTNQTISVPPLYPTSELYN